MARIDAQEATALQRHKVAARGQVEGGAGEHVDGVCATVARVALEGRSAAAARVVDVEGLQALEEIARK